MKLLDLPADIIAILPQYFSSIYDLYNVILTCRTLHSAYCYTDFKLPPVLPRPDGQILFQPHPRLLLTALARDLGDWACSSLASRYELYESLLQGYDGLLSLAERVTRVSLVDLQRLQNIKYSVLNPVARIVDFEAGPAMVRQQEQDPDEYGFTICLYPDLATLNYVVYCELFALYVDEILDNIVTPPTTYRPYPLGEAIRCRFVAYCLPDMNNHRNLNHESLGAKGHDDEWQLLDYLEMSRCDGINRRNEALRRFWRTDVLRAIPDEESLSIAGHTWDWIPTIDEKREILYVTVLEHLGWISLDMLLLDGLSRREALIKEVKDRVKSIPDELIGRWRYWEDFRDEETSISWENWTGLGQDCGNGMSTNSSTDEDLQAEAESFYEKIKSDFERNAAKQGPGSSIFHNLDGVGTDSIQQPAGAARGAVQRKWFHRSLG